MLINSTIVQKSLDLLEADRLLQKKSDKNHLIYPAIFFVFNFLLCAVFENSLKQDISHAILPLFLFVEFTLYITSSISHYQQQTLKMLHMATIFPVSSGGLYLYCLISDIFRPLAFVFLLTNTLFIAIVFHTALFASSLALFFFLLLFLCVEIIFAALALALRKSIQPELAIVMLTVLVVAVTLIASLVFKQQTILSSLPLISWCSNGIYAARSGEYGMVLLNIFLLMLTAGIGIIVGLRLSRAR